MFDTSRYLLMLHFNNAFELFSTYLNINKFEKITILRSSSDKM